MRLRTSERAYGQQKHIPEKNVVSYPPYQFTDSCRLFLQSYFSQPFFQKTTCCNVLI